MIVVFLFIGTVLLACSMIFMRRGINKFIWVLVGLVISVGSVVLMTLNYNTYLGMKEVQQTQTYPLTSSVKGKHVLLYRQLGTKNERIYYYATNPLQQKLAKTNPSTGNVTLKQKAKLNQVKITRTTRVYRNEEWRLLFGNGVANHQFVSQDYEFHLLPGWKLQKVAEQKQ
ncbi:DUF4811 domain-containing protein [Pediococcus cellicola]|uniref:DUF4811 domain-containing protein n=1 Tax=Pediococcus cellicola TaxID=319652 RepID=A0A0R2IQA8_9LACO|nr:DUF4811 domain-containing protein [Pediococcus cellicola]KRN67379.1 hypothetical protein IV80_GL000919 [Pediococcus cellicola]GEL15931.1 hypothetical protein PCE01_17330 [Pediococcus cellicola]